MIPVNPPIVNSRMNASAKYIAVVIRSEPPQTVAIHEKILIPVGIAISIEVIAKALSATGPIPVANM